ncbi:DUF5058 family protein [Tissierella praeacuta]|uniref:DUF5058 domain-containing protein n=1 Tax=Tissierella praeacuta DSM 18095 TaxID=1123404 RepID=A0A1M4WK54_9FIRM|nr:DUF5058 family protein [Tissierella praeacuta]MBU5255616.1 DUF5058 family protein [Tissierella praeacuta]TCU79103.1 uncharacterized protein DUF5058 [Tissierella praeacuta]SHE81574.1 protein of unknown function [Tissierella praeacuta DSM 18095]SUO99356.1 Uncharacterised protein [Tissierella praeacuta]
METNHLYYANHPIMWIVSIMGISIILIQSVLITRKSIKAGLDMGMDYSRIKKGIKTSAIGSIGPALGVVGSLLALLVTMGSPVSAFRLSIIGGSNFEAMAANFGAQALGSELSTNMTPLVFTNALWTMALGSIGWIVFVFLFGHRMDKVNNLLTSGRKALLPAVSIGAMLGSFAYFNIGNYLKVKTNPDITVSAISGLIIMIVCLKLGEKKFTWLKEWALTIAMFGGAIIGTLTF